VLAWFFLETLQKKQPVDDRTASSMAIQTELNMQQMQEQMAASLADRSGNEQQQRLDSPRGQALFRRCSDWTDMFEKDPGETARRSRDQACDELRRFVENGEPASGKDDDSPP
jgi:hypothetical protein